MKYSLQFIGNSRFLTLVLATAFLLASFTASAQGVLSSGGSTQTGTIQVEAQDDGYLTISGKNYEFSNELTQIYLNGEQVGDHVLDEGLVVRYTVNSGGVLIRLEVLGPINMIEALQDS
jgi:hypothetical protein